MTINKIFQATLGHHFHYFLFQNMTYFFHVCLIDMKWHDSPETFAVDETIKKWTFRSSGKNSII